MSELLPKELILDLLEESGAYGADKASHIIRSIKNFKPLKLQQKGQSDINIAIFEEAFDRALESLQKDFRKTYIESAQFTRRSGVMGSLKKLKSREGAFSLRMVLPDLREPIFIFISAPLFYGMLNFYLGGVGVKADKAPGKLTDIELAVLENVGRSLVDLLFASLEPISKIQFQLTDVNVNEEVITEQLKNEFWSVEAIAATGGQKSSMTFCLPVTFLKLVKKQMESVEQVQVVKPDPLWQKVVTDTVYDAELEMCINMGEFILPFEKSLGLKVGDVFEWEKYGQQVLVSFLDRPRIIATIGAVGENYAIRVEELMG